MNPIAWLLAALIFLIFTIIFFVFARDPIRFFATRERFEDEAAVDSISQKRIDAFLKDFDGYLKSINTRNTFRYYIASGGFLVACLVCILLAAADYM